MNYTTAVTKKMFDQTDLTTIGLEPLDEASLTQEERDARDKKAQFSLIKSYFTQA